MSTAFCWSSLFAWNDVGSGALGPANSRTGQAPLAGVANPDTKRRAFELIDASGLLKRLARFDPVPATDEDILRFHSKKYLEEVKLGNDQLSGFDLSDGVSHFGQGAYEMSLLAIGGAIGMVEKVMKGEAQNGYALINPPGHHAEPETGMGFCLFNNIGVTAQATLAKLGAKRVAIVDIDVHHGNGAERGFYGRKDVLTISIHQDRNFPYNRGFTTDRGEGEGFGYNLNIPLPPGCGNSAYEYTFDTLVLPALRNYAPDIILVASGADPNCMDPLARMSVTVGGFGMIATKLKTIATELCGGKIVFLQEGGYAPTYVPFCIHRMIDVLADSPTPLADPYAALFEQQYGSTSPIEVHQKLAIDSIVPHLADIAPTARDSPVGR